MRSLVLLHRNDLGGARDATDAAEAELAGTGPRYRSHWAQWARALILEADGRADEAMRSWLGAGTGTRGAATSWNTG